MNNFQRKGYKSNTAAGRDFEEKAKEFFEKKKNIILVHDFPLLVGVANEKKKRNFDLGSESEKIIVECKSHRWTESDNLPSAKITVWNEAMYYFLLAPDDYKKIFFCLKDYSKKRGLTLADYYLLHYKHLIPKGVHLWEWDSKNNNVKEYR